MTHCNILLHLLLSFFSFKNWSILLLLLFAIRDVFGTSVSIQVDLKNAFKEFDPLSLIDRKFTTLQIGNKHLVCGDISSNPSMLATKNKQKWTKLTDPWSLESQTLRYLTASKLAWLFDSCYLFKLSDSLFDICIGGGITHFQNSTLDLANTPHETPAMHKPDLDEIYNNGTIVQYYGNVTNQTSFRVQFDCSYNKIPSITRIYNAQNTLNFFYIYFEGASFCDWRQETNQRLLEQLPSNSFDLGSLVSSLEGWCGNYTDGGWWNYEYCHPDSAIQFHLLPGTNMLDRKHVKLLGSYISYGFPKTFGENKVPSPSPLFTQLRSPYLHESGPGSDIQWKKLPYFITDSNYAIPASQGHFFSKTTTLPDYPHNSILGTRLKALALPLQKGSFCKNVNGKPKYRHVTVFFHCPPDFVSKTTTKIMYVKEVALCKYEIHIRTPLVCSHPELLPSLQTKPETVLCYGATTSLSGFNNNNNNNTHLDINITEIKKKSNFQHYNLTSNFIQQLGNFVNITEPNFDNKIFILLSSPEIVPSDNSPTVLYNENEKLSYIPSGFFGEGRYIRKRNSAEAPKFKIGDTVRHKNLDITGVIVGWDEMLRAPKNWEINLLSVYPASRVKQRPFYRLHVQNNHDSFIDNKEFNENINALLPIILYSPESAVTIESHAVTNQVLFPPIEQTLLGLISPLSSLQELYPDDFEEDIE